MIDDVVLHNIFTLVSFAVSFEKIIYLIKYSSFLSECFHLLKQTVRMQVRVRRLRFKSSLVVGRFQPGCEINDKHSMLNVNKYSALMINASWWLRESSDNLLACCSDHPSHGNFPHPELGRVDSHGLIFCSISHIFNSECCPRK